MITMTDLSKASDTLGYAAKVPTTPGVTYWHNQRVGLLEVIDDSRASKDWLHYLMRTREYRSWVIGSATGTTVKHSSPSRIESFPFKLPPLEIQCEIAATLGALDDRIDNLRANNATLEAIAQAIFKSWFIDFDPVRAKMEGRDPEGMDAETAALFPSELEESELGLVPRGWRVGALAAVFELNPRRSLAKGTFAPYLDMASTPTKGHVPDQVVIREFSSGSKFINGDTLLARITPCLENGKAAFVDFLAKSEVGWGSTEFLVLRPKSPLPPYFGYLLARQAPFKAHAVSSMSGTSGRQRVQPDSLATWKLAVPDQAVSEAFGAVMESLQTAIARSNEESRTLSELRDLLLPRLISGKLRIEGPEAAVVGAA